jgi:2-oxoglutarate ferredoxin oxidoreductase subunit gamma
VLAKQTPIKIRFSGLGGQGIILSAFILGKAAVLYDDLLAIQTQSYGPEMRGTKCKSDLILSCDRSPINYPSIDKADVLVVMSQEAWNAYRANTHPKSYVFIDSDLVRIESNTYKIFRIPSTKIADQLGNRIVANIVMLGALVEITQIVSKPSIERAVTETVPESLRTLNVSALTKGFEIGKTLIA